MLAFSGVSNAQVSALNVGYCNGQVKTASTSGFTSTAKNTWISGAIFIPASQLKLYAGNHIDSIHAGLASSVNIDSLRVWIRTSLDGEDLASGAINKKVTPKLTKGWNTVGLTQPYQISSSSEGIYVGYSFFQKGSSVGLSIVNNPQSNALFVKMGTDSTWVDRCSEGALACEALVYGDQLPKYDLVLKSIEPQSVFVIDKGTLNVSATVKNLATVTITGFDAVCKIDGIDETCTAHIDTAIAYNEEKTVSFTIRPTITSAVPEKHQITVTLDNLTEGQDEDMDDNTQVDSFEVVSHDFTRNVVLEEFTTENCVNCPRVAGYIEDMYTESTYKDHVFQVEHHQGYYTDWLSQTFDSDYLWFYNDGGSTYAPAVMLDRSLLASESTPVFFPSSEDMLKAYANNRLSEPSFVSVKLTAQLDTTTNQLYIQATGERSKESFTVNPARITIFLAEDSIKAVSQSGASGTFFHRHVGRKVNAVWGDELTWNGNDYSYDCTMKVESYFVKKNLELVAFVSDYDAEDATKCEIANSAHLVYSDFETMNTDGIQRLQQSTDLVPEAYYSINGQRLSRPVKGVNIVKYSNGTFRKVILK